MVDRKEIKAFARKMVRKDLSLPLLKSSSDFPWFIKELDNHLEWYDKVQKKLLVPNFEMAKTIAILSDYGGQHQTSPYETYSILFGEYDSFGMFEKEMHKIRSQYGLQKPYKEIEYKDLGYGPLKRALPDILRASDYLINGLLLTLIVDKRFSTLFGPDCKETNDRIQKIFEDNRIDHWKPKIREKTLRILHTIAYFLKLLSFKGQKLLWMTDEDDIVSNSAQINAISEVFLGILNLYVKPGFFELVGYATPFKDIKNFDFGSFLGLSDLIAGAIADYFQKTRETGQPSVSSDASDKLLTWVALNGLLLKKLSFKIDWISVNQYRFSVIEFILKKQPPPERIIEIEI